MFDRDDITCNESLEMIDGLKEIENALNDVVKKIDNEIAYQTEPKIISLYRDLKEMLEQSIHDSCIKSAIADFENILNEDEDEETDASLLAWHHRRVL